jgi:hypothetical protein
MHIHIQANGTKFIRNWLLNNDGCDVLDSKFVDEFIAATGSKHEVTLWGANKCKNLSSLLGSMYKQGLLKRWVITLGPNWQPGFPKWVYTYELANS